MNILIFLPVCYIAYYFIINLFIYRIIVQESVCRRTLTNSNAPSPRTEEN